MSSVELNLVRIDNTLVAEIFTHASEKNVLRLCLGLLVERWAHDVDSSGTATGGNPGEKSEAEQAQLVRITADQVVSDVTQKALTHMLHDAKSGQDSFKIRQTLEELKLEGYNSKLDMFSMESMFLF